MVDRGSHKAHVGGSIPPPATNYLKIIVDLSLRCAIINYLK